MTHSVAGDRRVDPIHFFNSCGLSAVTEAFYLEALDLLRKDNERLERLVARARQRGLLEVSEIAN